MQGQGGRNRYSEDCFSSPHGARESRRFGPPPILKPRTAELPITQKKGLTKIMTIWIKQLLKNLDEHVDEPIKEKILGACGEKCPFTHLTDERLLEIRKNSTNDIDFLNNLCVQWRMVKEEEQYYVVFDQCYCPLINEDIQGASKTLCYCTLGNLKHKLKISLDQNAEVIMLNSVLAGDDECRFLIKLKNV